MTSLLLQIQYAFWALAMVEGKRLSLLNDKQRDYLAQEDIFGTYCMGNEL